MPVKGGANMSGTYTAADYFSLVPEGTNKWELIKGFFEMSPSPLTEHQRVVMDMGTKLYNFFMQSKCRVFVAPFDVQLGESVVQPDIVVICRREIIVERGCKGAPDLIVEIISPSTRKLDEEEKKQLYEEFLVPELWLVYPEARRVVMHTMLDGKYEKTEVYDVSCQEIASSKFPKLTIRFDEIFYDW